MQLVRRPGVGERGARGRGGSPRAPADDRRACAGWPTRGRCAGWPRRSVTSTCWWPPTDPGPVMEAFAGLRRGRPRDRARRHEDLDPDAERAPGRPPRGPARGLGRRDDLLHRLEGPQHPDPRDGGAQGAEAQRVRPVRGRRPATCSPPRPRRRSTSALGLPYIEPTLARGPRRDRGGAGRRAAGPDRAAADSAGTCTRTRTSPTGSRPWRRCSRPPPSTGTPTTPSPTTRPTSRCSG